MKTVISVESEFTCSLERAFKTPILGDATIFLAGYGVIPAVEKFTEDDTWGQPGGTRIPHSAKSLLSKGGEIGVDVVAVREENKYWRWGVAEFRQPSMGFTEFQGELFFEKQSDQSISVKWVYSLFSASVIAYPFHWLFGKVFWKGQMKQGIQKMKTYAESGQSFLYK